MCPNTPEAARQQQATFMVIGCSLMACGVPLMLSETHWAHYVGWALLAMSIAYQLIGVLRLSAASKAPADAE